MRLTRFLSTLSFVTAFSLLYVYQQTEIFRLAYSAQKKHTACEELLDKNIFLRYNIKRSASLIQLGDKISASNEFQMPDNYSVIRLSGKAGRIETSKAQPRQETLLSRLFSIKRQAEAETLKSSVTLNIEGGW
ncbi:MAG: hypothetical protein AB1481_03900 [Candidatus Omnitrophota bacterium]